ncbi:hypothetical protein C8Q75DRAFT_806198 [Abortiporus biennis]|nr:hypothetical protein C8Q75DRAFT_806198 [Abortiporus biennis]
MPPKQRKKAKKEITSQPEDDNGGSGSTSRGPGEVSIRGGERPSQTSKGLLSLPIELFDQILSKYPRAEEKHIVANSTTLDLKFSVRTKVLRALSQTCKSLRTECLPRLWERIEVCYVEQEKDVIFFKVVSRNLERISRGLMKTPEIAKLVKIFTVTLTRCSTDTTLSPFVWCLRNLPNLHTLQVLHAHSQMTTALKNAFSNVNLSQIRTLILPNCAHNILRSCDGARNVTCNEHDGGRFLNAIHDSSIDVQSLRNIGASDALLKRLPKSVPTLEVISVDIRPYIHYENHWLSSERTETIHYDVSIYQHLKRMKNLTTIELLVSENMDSEQTPNGAKLQDHVNTARDTLKGNKAAGRKSVVLRYRAWRDDERKEIFSV